ncbi:MAG: tyrosine-type recombinase/integrase [Candidatus Sigynarchaeota archaeon]
MITQALQTAINGLSDEERGCVAAHLENERKKAIRTEKLACSVLTNMFQYMGKGLLAITKRDVLAFLSKIDKTLSDSSKIVYRSHLNSFFSFAVDYFEMDDIEFKNPMPSREFYMFSRGTIKDESDNDGRLLTMDQLRAILNVTENYNKRDYIYTLIIMHTGMRPAEGITIRIENMFIKERYLRTGYEPICQKSSKHMKKPLEFCFSPEVATVLEDYLLYINRKEGWLFPSPDTSNAHVSLNWYGQIARKYSKMVGFDFSWGDLRHTLITLRKMKFDGQNGRLKILDWESEVIMNHVPKTMENRKYLEKPIEFKRKLFDTYYIYHGLI